MINKQKVSLYNSFRKNKDLVFKDLSGNTFKLTDLIYENAIPDGRELAFLYLDNSLASVSALMTFLKSKHVIALLSSKLDSSFKLNLEKKYQPALIIDSDRSHINGYTSERLGNSTNLYITTKALGCSNLHPELKILLSTSGSTGTPKFVKLSEKNLIENAHSIIDYLPITPADVCPLTLPVYYSYGLSILTTNCIAGGTIICGDMDCLQSSFWRSFKEFGFTSLSGVPYFYETLSKLKFTNQHVPSLRYLTQAGGKMNNALLMAYGEYAKQKNIAFFTMYGQTEATARMSYLPPNLLLTKMGSIGRPIINGSFQIAPSTNELCYSGPNVFGGYAENKDDLHSYIKPKILSTGDIAKVDAQGFYYITGRIKRIIKLVGLRYNLDEIEQSLKNEYYQIPFTCTNMKDEKLRVFTTSTKVTLEQLQKFILSKFKINIRMVKLSIINEFPLTPNGKIDYNKLNTIL